MVKEFVTLIMFVMEMGKEDSILVIIATVAKRLKHLIKNMNLIHSNYH